MVLLQTHNKLTISLLLCQESWVLQASVHLPQNPLLHFFVYSPYAQLRIPYPRHCRGSGRHHAPQDVGAVHQARSFHRLARLLRSVALPVEPLPAHHPHRYRVCHLVGARHRAYNDKRHLLFQADARLGSHRGAYPDCLRRSRTESILEDGYPLGSQNLFHIHALERVMMGFTAFVEAVAHFYIEVRDIHAARNLDLLEACLAHPLFGLGNDSLA